MRLASSDIKVRKMLMASGSTLASEQGTCQLQIKAQQRNGKSWHGIYHFYL